MQILDEKWRAVCKADGRIYSPEEFSLTFFGTEWTTSVGLSSKNGDILEPATGKCARGKRELFKGDVVRVYAPDELDPGVDPYIYYAIDITREHGVIGRELPGMGNGGSIFDYEDEDLEYVCHISNYGPYNSVNKKTTA